MRNRIKQPEPPPTWNITPIILTVREAARALRISPGLLLDLERAGEIVAVDVGLGSKKRSLRFLPADLLAFARSRRDLGEIPSDGASPAEASA